MTEKKPFDHAFTFKDDIAVKEQFADEAYGLMLTGSVAKITFTVSRPDDPKPGHKGPPKGLKVPVARVALPAQGFADLYNKMHQMLVALEQQGIVIRENGKAKSTIQ